MFFTASPALWDLCIPCEVSPFSSGSFSRFSLFLLSLLLSLLLHAHKLIASSCLLWWWLWCWVVWTEPVALQMWYTCVTTAAAACQPSVKAGTVGPELTSACHYGPV